MPVGTWIEKPESRAAEKTATTEKFTRLWAVQDAGNDLTDVYESALYYNPATMYGLIRQRVSPTPSGGGFWFVEVEYGLPNAANGAGAAAGEPSVTPPPEPSETEPLGPGYSFDTTGQTAHITQSILTRSKTKRGGGTARDFKQAIGVTRDKVEGVDVFAPKLEFTISMQVQTLSLADVKRFRSATGKVNSASWLGFNTEEVLYLGGSGSYAVGQKWQLSHKFAFAETQTDIAICTGLTIPLKRGWDYIWFTYAEEANAGGIVSLPLEGYVEQVYPTVNFDSLQLNGGS